MSEVETQTQETEAGAAGAAEGNEPPAGVGAAEEGASGSTEESGHPAPPADAAGTVDGEGSETD